MRFLSFSSFALSFAALVITFSTPHSGHAEDAAPSAEASKGSVAPSAEADTAKPGDTAAILNGQKITFGELDSEMKLKPAFAMYETMGQQSPEYLNKLRFSVLNNMINRKLLIDEATKSGAVNEEEIKQRTEDVITRGGGEEKLTQSLATKGFEKGRLRTEIGNDLRIQSYIENSLMKDLKISDEDLKKAYESAPQKYATKDQVQASHILIKVEPTAKLEEDQAAKAKIDELYAEVSKPGADFGAVAKGSSQCPSAPRGGDLGFFEKGRMVPEFEKEAFALEPGSISKPFKTQFGYHIVKVTEKRPAEAPSFEKAKPLLERELRSAKASELVESKVKELRSAAKIEIKLAQPTA